MTILTKFNSAEIIKDGNWECLYVNGKLWTVDIEKEWYEKYLFPYVRGNVLEFGLGLGIASNGILERCTHLTTVELNQDVIDLYVHRHGRKFNHYILCADEFAAIKNRLLPCIYDLVFIDTWTDVDRAVVSKVNRLTTALKEAGCLRKNCTIISWYGDFIDIYLKDPERFCYNVTN